MPIHPTDPRLQDCVEEIKEILRKYDVGATVAVYSGNGHSEYMNYITEPSWSCLTLMNTPEGTGIRFKAAVKTAPREEKLMERLKAQKTVNMLVHIRDNAGQNFMAYDNLVNVLSKEINISEEKGIHTPWREDL